MGAEMSTSEVLNKAADLIEQRGWTTGIYLVSDGALEADVELWCFNDSSAAERVIGVLRATALIESARERESVEV